MDEGWLVVTEAAALCSLQDALGAGDLNRDMTLGHRWLCVCVRARVCVCACVCVFDMTARRLLVLSQVSSAMEVVAAAGLVHCYLSLDNVVLCSYSLS